MMDRGQIVLDLHADEKSNMTVQDLVDKFTEVKHEMLLDDSLLLA
jgi:putative ABC transport system ATP-binding protein